MNWADVWSNVGQVLSGIAIGLVIFLGQRTKVWLKKRAKSVKSILNANLMLKQLLAEIRSFYDADRVLLYQFHNGDHYVSGTSIQKVSLTHFVTAIGVGIPISVETIQQNIPISYIAQTTDDIQKNPWVLYQGDTMFEDSYFKGILRYNGVSTAILRGVFNIKHDMVGYLVISWFDDVKLTPEQLEEVKGFSTRLGDELQLGAK